MGKFSIYILVLFLSMVNGQWSMAQDAAKRYEIDAKRIGVQPYDKDALPRSREFIRLDSTYYVGHYYEGIYKYERAADYLGYKNCIQPLKKALLLFEKDFKKDFTNAPLYDIKQMDIRSICATLYESYSNVEQPDSAMWILEKVQSWKLPYDFMEYHIKAAWLIHRNRYHLHKYSFLKNSVEENEELALNHLYQALAQGNTSANFYLAIIYNYLQNVDSTKYYYDYLLQNGGISYNNYAHFKNTLGQFSEAIENFEKEKFAFDKRLIEPYYFLPTLYINSGRSLDGIHTANEIITKNGSTPGFGWYNIALARSYLYNGQLDSCEKAIEKAAQFKELHLATTLGQAQYDFAVNVVKLMLVNQKIERIKFFNPGWWYSITDLLKMSELFGDMFLLRFAIVNEFANNPERQNVIYTLFSSENVIGFDEVWNMIKDISPEYFTNFYKQKMETEKRENIQRYMQFFYGSFLFKTGNNSGGKQMFENILYKTLLDTAHEKLFLGRVAETLARQYDKENAKDKYNRMIAYYLSEYPQLVPFSGFKIKMKMNVTGISDGITKKVTNELKDCNVDWNDGGYIAIANINFEKKKEKYEVYYSVQNTSGKIIIPSHRILFKKPKGLGKELALRLFGVNGPLEYEVND
ncbi:MAG: hypothetical protein JWN83_350 [Chitinophagaceae bacterium]|nr:hypothetical protein [Chitinophagaceae bacterium]